MRCKLRHYKTLVISSLLLLTTNAMIAEAEYQAHYQYSTTTEQTEDDIFELDIQPDIVEQPSYKVHHNTNSRQSNNIVNNQEEPPYSAQIRQYSREIDNSCTRPESYSKRAYYYKLAGKLDLALADYNYAVQLGSRPEDYSSRGDLHFKLGKYAEAAKDYQYAAFKYSNRHIYTLKPRILKLLHSSATAYRNINDYKSAVEMYTNALFHISWIMSKEDISEIYFKKGELYLNLNRPKTALVCYKKALKKNPNNKLAVQAITKLGSLKLLKATE